jgi:hypothetical protein
LHVTPSTLALVVSIVFALAGGPAGAAKGKLSVLNCGPTKVKLCVFDKTDISLLSENRSVELGPGEWSTKVGCSTNGGCKVKVVKSGSGCINTSHETSIADAKTLDEVAYRFNGSSFDKVSDDRAYFDSAANRVCPGTPANIQFAALNCTGGSLSLCVYKDGSLIRAAALSVGASSTFSCGKPDACTVTAGNCTATLQKTVTYTVSAGAYTVTRRQSLPGVLSFARASDDVNHFENVKVSCPATK